MSGELQQELSEDLVFSDDPAADLSDDEPHGASSEEPEQQQQAVAQPRPDEFASSSSRRQKGLDITGASSTSHQSSTLRASLEDELDAAGPTPSPPVEVPFRRTTTDMSQLPHFGKGLHHHQQQQQPYTRLGTSAPIAIPNMANWRGGGDKGSGRQVDAASTFIPPHQLSRQEDFTFSFTGASPSATLKRERLRARNAILRSTGFIEPRAGSASAGGAAAAVAAVAAEPAVVARTPVQSSLTAALTTIGES